MLSRTLTRSEGMTNYWFGKDDELAAALILSGKVPHTAVGRYCFQTTYLNERWHEYLEHSSGYSMVWSLRNPHSVVYSMVYNWKGFALNELFLSCGYAYMNHEDRIRFLRFGVWGVPRIRRGIYAYIGKVAQLFSLAPALSQDRLVVVEYDQLIKWKDIVLPRLYERLNIRFKAADGNEISERSLGKKDKLSSIEKRMVDDHCTATFERARTFINLSA